MSTVERLLRWLEIPINLLLWIALIAGFLMMIHVGVDVTGRTFPEGFRPGADALDAVLPDPDAPGRAPSTSGSTP